MWSPQSFFHPSTSQLFRSSLSSPPSVKYKSNIKYKWKYKCFQLYLEVSIWKPSLHLHLQLNINLNIKYKSNINFSNFIWNFFIWKPTSPPSEQYMSSFYIWTFWFLGCWCLCLFFMLNLFLVFLNSFYGFKSPSTVTLKLQAL